MTRVRTAAAVAAALLGPLLLAGCGIKPTGVVESGAAATVVITSPTDRAGVVYFVTPDDQLVPSPQVDSPPSSATGTVLRLLSGPGPQERAAGLGTRLPALEDGQAGEVGVSFLAVDHVEARLPFKVAGLTRLARRQLVCTVTSVTASESVAVEVALRGPDTSLGAERCDVGR